MYIQKIFFLSLSKMIWKKNPTFKLNNLRRGTLLFDAISKPHSILFIVVTHCSPDYKGVAIFTRVFKSTGLSVLGADQGGLTKMFVWGTLSSRTLYFYKILLVHQSVGLMGRHLKLDPFRWTYKGRPARMY